MTTGFKLRPEDSTAHVPTHVRLCPAWHSLMSPPALWWWWWWSWSQGGPLDSACGKVAGGSLGGRAITPLSGVESIMGSLFTAHLLAYVQLWQWGMDPRSLPESALWCHRLFFPPKSAELHTSRLAVSLEVAGCVVHLYTEGLSGVGVCVFFIFFDYMAVL